MDSYTRILYLVFILIMCSSMHLVSGGTRCVERDRIALLQFKKGLVDNHSLLKSWKNNSDCCQWRGVGCNNATGRVVTLDLSVGYWSEDLQRYIYSLGGEIDSSLLSLSSLTYLDLSGNDFTRIPKFIGSFKKLQHLNLSWIELTSSAEFPYQLANLSALQTLDLAYTSVVIKNSHWLSRLSSLEYLNMNRVNLSQSIGLLDTAIKLPSLVELHLAGCSFPNETVGSFLDPVTNMSDSFAVLDLSYNYHLPSSSIYPWLFNFSESLTDINLFLNELDPTIPKAFGTISNLKTLDLSFNQLEGGIPRLFRNLSGLRELDLSLNNLEQDLHSLFGNLPVRSLQVLRLNSNHLTGSLPDFTTFTALTELYLGANQLNGSFPTKFQQNSNLLRLDLGSNRITGSLPDPSIFLSLRVLYFERNKINGTLGGWLGSLSMLEALDASFNLLHGTISEAQITNLSRLEYLDLSYNSLALEVSPDWSPSFQLNGLWLSSCKLGGSFPKWLKTQKSISVVDISNAGITDSIPSWFQETTNHGLRFLNFSSNQIHGTVPDFFDAFEYGRDHQLLIDMSSNNFSGKLPLFPRSTTTLILNDNMFSGPISSLCNMPSLLHLDLSNNNLSGELPDCLGSLALLVFLNLENNKFSGAIPGSIGSLHQVRMMSMRGNRLRGEMPLSLRNCTTLELLDFGENELFGKIPEWIDDSWSELRVLSLPSNRFYGTIPTSMCKVKSIQILDLSINNISGNIPKCFNGFSAMTTREKGTPGASIAYYDYKNDGHYRGYFVYGIAFMFKELLQWKGRQSEYQNTLGLVISLDLSSNRLTGVIPQQLMSLSALIALNLSRNCVTGPIPKDVGSLTWLDFLDLSRNNLVDKISTSLSKLGTLGMLDLSFNKLSGKIPENTKLQSFDVSSYMGNAALCGVPLPNGCPGDGPKAGRHEDVVEEESDEKLEGLGFYVSIVVGFAFGFWGLCGSLILRSSWRHAYFEFFNRVKNQVLVGLDISFSMLQRRPPT